MTQLNQYFSLNEPWKLASSKVTKDEPRLNTILFVTLESCRIFSLLLQPVMPELMSNLLSRLNVPENERLFKDAVWGKGLTLVGKSIQQGVLLPKNQNQNQNQNQKSESKSKSKEVGTKKKK